VLGLPVIIALAGVVIAGGLALRAYFIEQYADDPYRGVMDLLREQEDAGIVVANESLYHRLYPFLGTGAGMRLVDGGEHSREQLVKLAAGHDVLWVVDSGTEAEQVLLPDIEKWLSERYHPMDSKWLVNSQLRSYATGEALSLQPEEASFGGEALLAAAGWDQGPFRPGEFVRLGLQWQALTEMEQAYAVFVHLVGPDGEIGGQRDSQPANGFRPTSGWVVGEPVQDNHAVRLGSDLPPGEYRLVLGLYDTADGQRLSLLDEGAAAKRDALELGTVVLLGQEE
jgi:hypothetical protein